MKRRRGFALSLALNCMAMLLLSALTLRVFLTVEMRSAAVRDRAMRQRLDLAQALALSMSRLQAAAGRDELCTFSRDGAFHSAARDGQSVPLSGAIEGVDWSWDVRDLSARHHQTAAGRAALAAGPWVQGQWGRGKVPLRVPIVAGGLDGQALELDSPPEGPRNGSHRGLLTDAVRGGFRTDLSDAARFEERIGRDVCRRWEDLYSEVDPLRGVDVGKVGVRPPLLVGLTLSVGVFNSRADGRHRLRFHASGRIWNDTVLPLASADRGRMLVIELRGAPTITVTNLDSGAVIEADLEDLPVIDVGAVEQGRRDRALWFIVGVDDPRASPMASSGLLAGETYAFLSPSASSQPQGLARLLDGSTWRMDRRPHGPGWRRPSPEVMTPADRIRIRCVFPSESALLVRKYVGEPRKDAGLDSYEGELCQVVSGIGFESFEVELAAEDYSRPDSSGYRIQERRFCLSAAVDDVTPGQVMRLAASARAIGDGAPVGWSSRHPLAFGAPDEDCSRRSGSLLWDEGPGERGALAPWTFGRAAGPEIPLRPILSPGALRHFGDPDWRAALDACVFLPRAGEISHPRLRSWSAEAGDASARWYVDGSFNVNSTERSAWTDLLWSAGAQGGTGEEVLCPTRPSTLCVPLSGMACPRLLREHELAELSPSELDEVALNQPARILGRAQIERLAEAVVEEVVARGPFRSLADFVEQEVLDRALERSGMAAVPPSAVLGLPLRLCGADLVELFGPQLCVRGDTFEVEVRVAGSGSAATLTAVMQRTPSDPLIPACLGRRFRVVSVRYP